MKVTAKLLDQCVRSREYDSAMMPKEAALSLEIVHPNIVRTHKVVVQPKLADFNGVDYRKGMKRCAWQHSNVRSVSAFEPRENAAGDEVVEAFIVREWCGSGSLQVFHQLHWKLHTFARLQCVRQWCSE